MAPAAGHGKDAAGVFLFTYRYPISWHDLAVPGNEERKQKNDLSPKT